VPVTGFSFLWVIKSPRGKAVRQLLCVTRAPGLEPVNVRHVVVRHGRLLLCTHLDVLCYAVLRGGSEKIQDCESS